MYVGVGELKAVTSSGKFAQLAKGVLAKMDEIKDCFLDRYEFDSIIY